MDSAQVTFSEQMMKRVVQRFWRRKIGPSLPIVTALIFAFLVYLIWTGDRSWLVGVVGAAVLTSILTMLTIYVAQYRSSMSRLKRMGNLTATVSIYNNYLRVESGAGASEIVWNTITECWVGDEFWMIFLAPNQFFTIPAENLSQEFSDALRSKIENAGAAVT